MKLKYKYALANVWWNKNAQDQPLFRNIDLMNEYFENVRTPWGDLSNFVIKDSVETDTYIHVPETMSINEVLNYHYLLVQEIDEETNEPIRILHYFAEISQDSGNQYYCMLERDVIIDYYILGEFRNRPYTMIHRTHLDRFVYENNKFKVNGSIDSPLYIKENIDTDAPLCVQRKEISNDLNVDNTYINKTRLWAYVYLNLPENNALYSPYNEDGIDQGYTLFCFPLFTKSYLKVNNTNYLWDLETFLKYNNTLIPYILNIRISFVNPFGNMNESNYIAYSEDIQLIGAHQIFTPLLAFSNDYNLIQYTGDGNTYYYVGIKNGGNAKYFNISNGKVSNILDLGFNITKDDITSAKNYVKEVKLFNGIIKAKINCGTTDGNEYNLLDLIYHEDDNAYYQVIESIVPGITRCYHGIVIEDSIYNELNFKNGNQNSTSIDTSIPYASSQYDTFLAQNKNFYQSANLARDTKMLQGTVAGITGGFLKGGIPGAIVGGLGAGALSAFNNYVDYKQQDYKMDNLKSAPTNIRNLEGNALLTTGVTGFNVRFEIWQPLQSNLEKIADYLFFNGYEYNKLGKLSDFDNTRKYFNFIQGDINGLCYNMNEKGYKLLREKLLNGIRFWHEEPCNVDFNETDNYETWIDNIE